MFEMLTHFVYLDNLVIFRYMENECMTCVVTSDQVNGGESREDETQRPTCDVTSDQVSGDESREEEMQRPTCDVTLDQMSGAESREEETQRSTEKLKEETQNLKGDGDLRLNIMESESIEAAFLDLEELIVRFEWLKDKLTPDPSEKSSWKYEDYCQSSRI